MYWLSDPQIWANLFTLTLLEIVLGVDNLIFIAIVSSRLPIEQQAATRRIGLLFAMVTRLILLACVVWIAGLTQALFSIGTHAFSGRDVLFIIGGLFLLIKGAQEIRELIIASHGVRELRNRGENRLLVIVQIMFFDIIFSLDSVITAVGLSQRLWVMSFAIVIAIMVMMFASEVLSRFIERYPRVKMLALSFLLLVGIVLVADGLAWHIPRAYLYIAIIFSVFVEFMNILAHKDKVNS